jgi:methyltransferase
LKPFFYFLTGFVIFQRLVELIIAKRNEKTAFANGGVEYDREGYKVIVLMHTCFFLSMIFEFFYFARSLNRYWFIYFIFFCAAQILRYWAIITLGKSWNTRIIITPGSGLIKRGPYRFMDHPNYSAVITELAVLPMIFSCYITAIVFSFFNLLLLSRRIRIEEKALAKLKSGSNYGTKTRSH